MIQLLAIRLPDEQLERVRRNHHDAIAELQRLPLAGARVLENQELADGVDTLIAHGLGRTPAIVLPSCPRGPVSSGRIEELRDGTYDRTKFIKLRASGYGASVTLEVLVL